MKNSLKFTFSVVLIFVTVLMTNSQVLINTAGGTPDASAMLEIDSDSRGLLIPRMITATEKILRILQKVC